MAYTQAQLDALDAAIARGVLEVQNGQERVKYRSLAEMRQTRRVIADELAGRATGVPSVLYPTTGRGL
jgi:hypothetical protein